MTQQPINVIFIDTRYKAIVVRIKKDFGYKRARSFVNHSREYALGFILCGEIEGATFDEVKQFRGKIQVFSEKKDVRKFRFAFTLPRHDAS